MNKEKQNDVRQELLAIFAPSSLSFEEANSLTDKIIEIGYRKQSEVAREVISEFKTLVKIRMIKLGIYPVALARTLELVEKKLTEKYTEV